VPAPGWSGRIPFRDTSATTRQGRGGYTFPLAAFTLVLFYAWGVFTALNFTLVSLIRVFGASERRERGSCSGWVLGASPFVITCPLLVRLKGVLLLGLGGVPCSRGGEGLRAQCASVAAWFSFESLVMLLGL
jgi:hypothetical protein